RHDRPEHQPDGEIRDEQAAHPAPSGLPFPHFSILRCSTAPRLDAILTRPGFRRHVMRYVMLIYETPADFASRERVQGEPYVAAWRAYHQALVEAGAYVAGAPLKDPGSATTIRVKGGERHVQDGPFAETKDQLGGIAIVEFESLDAALEWAVRCPAAATG